MRTILVPAALAALFGLLAAAQVHAYGTWPLKPPTSIPTPGR